MIPSKGNIGSSFDEFLKEDGSYEEITATAVKRALAAQILQAKTDGAISKAEMARRMKTSRCQLDRLLDPEQTTTQLDTLYKAAHAIGRKIRIELA